MQVARYPNKIYPYLVSYRSIRVAMFSSKRIDGVRIRFFFYQQFMPPWKTGTYCSSIGHQLLIYLLEKLYCACAVKFLLLGVRPLVNGREAAIEERNFRSRLFTANHGNMHVHFKFVTSLRRYSESYVLVHKALIVEHVI